jgi:hypothetical protein
MKGYGVGYTGNEHSSRIRKFEGGIHFKYRNWITKNLTRIIFCRAKIVLESLVIVRRPGRPGSFEMCTYLYNNDPKAKPPRGGVGYSR